MTRLFQRIAPVSHLSLRTVITLYGLLITVPLSVLLIWLNLSTLSGVQEQMLEARQSLLEIHGERMDQLLEDIESKITLTFRDNNAELTTLTATKDEFAYSMARFKMTRVLDRWLEQFPDITVVFLYLPERGDYIAVERMGAQYELREELERYVRGTVAGEGEARHWQGTALCDRYYLLNATPLPRIWMGACLDSAAMLSPMAGASIPEAVELAAVFPGDVTGSAIKLSSDSLEQDDSFITVPSRVADYSFRLRLHQVDVWSNLSPQQTTLLVLTALLILLALLVIARISWAITSPLRRMVSAMEDMLLGEWNTKVEVGQSFQEMRILQGTFNEMAQEIKNLKISIYEERLSRQQTQLHYAQVKAKPHFYLNCLNIVYNLAALGEVDKVKRVSHMLMHSFRFILNSDKPFVRLREELDNVENYVALQEIRYPDGFVYRCKTGQGMEVCRVPPMLLLPLVENSFKYAIDPDRNTVIETEAFLQGGKLHLRVRDNGVGFPDAVLRAFAEGEPITQEGRTCIGLMNIRQRLFMAYGDGGAMEIGNLVEGGAWAELCISRPGTTGDYEQEGGLV